MSVESGLKGNGSAAAPVTEDFTELESAIFDSPILESAVERAEIVSVRRGHPGRRKRFRNPLTVAHRLPFGPLPQFHQFSVASTSPVLRLSMRDAAGEIVEMDVQLTGWGAEPDVDCFAVKGILRDDRSGDGSLAEDVDAGGPGGGGAPDCQGRSLKSGCRQSRCRSS